MNITTRKVLVTSMFAIACFTCSSAFAAKCLYISSYHQGYEWSDGVERGLLPELEGNCEFKQFDMDTKRNSSEEFQKEAALKAKQLIESFQPDVVIVSDDNAVKYLVEPYYKDKTLPFVFCGVNWSGEKYGLPYTNVTGMVEVSPISAQINVAKATLPGMKTIYYIDADNNTGQKTVKYYQDLFESKGYEFSSTLISTFDEWKNAFVTAQNYDVVILRNNAGIKDWNDEDAKKFAMENSKKLSMTESDWMMPYTLLGMTKIPEEQGMWAGKTAISILNGANPAKIKIVENHKSNIFINKALSQKLNLPIPESIVKMATIVE